MRSTTRPTRVAIAGLHGYGAVHIEQIARMGPSVRLVAVADPLPPSPGSLPAATAVYTDLDVLLSSVPDIDVVIIATPLDTHFDLAARALRAGADVYLEKPPVTSISDFDRLLDLERTSEGSIQVGFQGLGLHDSPAFLEAIEEIGEVTAIGAIGLWQRPDAYWNRSRWAGRRVLDGIDIVDGVVTNPFAHAIASALHLAGVRDRTEIARIDVDLYRANPIESDDTSVVRIRTAHGVTITGAFTLCAADPVEPVLEVMGSAGSLRFHYTADRIERSDGTITRLERRSLLENLIAHRGDRRIDLLSPLRASAPFMAVLDRIRSAAAPMPIPREFLSRLDETTTIVTDIAGWIALAVAEHATFAELGAPWTENPADAPSRERPAFAATADQLRGAL
ncbi:Gfo/Idh/MocA family oxidoreductase [Microbacterium sp. LTA6]|uniref:Gfo/Idh/MocA family protein n=1 Tax=unclassified Microbacterium TaxID=2609290 RepID=UPI003139F6E8